MLGESALPLSDERLRGSLHETVGRRHGGWENPVRSSQSIGLNRSGVSLGNVPCAKGVMSCPRAGCGVATWQGRIVL